MTGTETPAVPALGPDADTGSSKTDDLTSDARPVIVGTAVANAGVTLYDSDGTTVLGTATAGSTGSYSIAAAKPLDDGDHMLTVTATAPGFAESARSPSLLVTIDTEAPDAPTAPALIEASDTGRSHLDGVTSSIKPTLSGIAEPGSTVTLHANGGATPLGETTAGADGSYAITTAALAGGSYHFTTVATDGAGNKSPASAATVVTIDTTALPAPLAPTLSSGSDTGELHTDGLTSATTPIVTGIAEAGATVDLLDTDGTLLGVAMADPSGAYAIASKQLVPGAHTLTITSTDEAGNVSAASRPLNVLIDSAEGTATSTPDSGPSTEGTVSFSVHFDQPIFAPGGLASSDFQLVATGSAGGDILDVSGNGQDFTIRANGLAGSGELRLDFGRSTGITDLAGNPVTFSESAFHPVDGTAEQTTVVVSTSGTLEAGSGSDPSPSASGRLVAFDSTDVTLRGSPASGDANIYVKDLTTGGLTRVSLGDGNSTYASLSRSANVIAFASDATDLVPGGTPAGETNIYVEQLKLADPLSGDSVAVVPGSIRLVSRGIGTDESGSVAGDRPVLSADGTVVAFDSTAALLPGGESGVDNVYAFNLTTDALTLVSGGTGRNEYAFVLGPADEDPYFGHGFKELASVADRPAGQGGDFDSQVTSISEDGSEIAFQSTATDLGTGPLPSFSPYVDYPPLRSYVSNLKTGTIYFLDGNGSFGDPNFSKYATADPHLSEDGRSVAYQVAFGQSVTLFDRTLATGSIDQLTPGPYAGIYDSPSLSEGGGLVAYVSNAGADPGEPAFAITVGQVGNASPDTPIAQGYRPVLTSAGNAVTYEANDPSDAASDSVYETMLGVTAGIGPIATADEINAAAKAAITSTGGLTVTGVTNAAIGSTVLLGIGNLAAGTYTNVAIGTVTTDGQWSLTAPGASLTLADGSYAFGVQVGTPTGNSFQSLREFTIDTMAPTPPAAPTLEHDDVFSNQDRPTVKGIAEPGATVTLYDGAAPAVAIGRATADVNGAYFISVVQGDNVGLTQGAHTLFVTATDPAGNTSLASAGLSFTVDSIAPDQPGLPTPAIASDTGASDADGVTSDATPTLIGKAEPKAIVTLHDTDGIAVLGSAVADGHGDYSIASSALREGAHTLSVTATDLAGNVSPVSQGIVVTIDTASPGVPTDLVVDGQTVTGGKLAPFLDVSGKAEPGSTVALHVDGDAEVSGQATVSDDGDFTINSEPLQPGDHKLTVIATDLAGNVSQASLPVSAGITDQPTPPPNTSPDAPLDQGTVSDDEIAGAMVFADANGNGVLDPGEAYAKTNVDGKFALYGGTGNLVATGGQDSATGLTLPGNLVAPTGATAITPLTTLLSAYMAVTGASQAEAESRDSGLYLSSGGISFEGITSLDPVAAARMIVDDPNDATDDAHESLNGRLGDTATLFADAVGAAGGSASAGFAATFDVIAADFAARTFNASQLQDQAAVAGLFRQVAAAALPGVTIDDAAISTLAAVTAAGNAAILEEAPLSERSRDDAPTTVRTIDAIEHLEQGTAASAVAAVVRDPALADGTTPMFTGDALDAAVRTAAGLTLTQLTLAPGSDAGLSPDDHIINVDTPTFIGTTLPGATVTLVFTDYAQYGLTHRQVTVVGSAIADATGHFSVVSAPLPLTSNYGVDSFTLNAVVSGINGQLPPVDGSSVPPSDQEFHLQVQTPSILAQGIFDIAGISEAAGAGSDADHVRLLFRVQVPQHGTVEIYADGGTTPIGSGITGLGNGNEGLIETTGLAPGPHTFTLDEILPGGAVLTPPMDGSFEATVATFTATLAAAPIGTGMAYGNGTLIGATVGTAMPPNYVGPGSGFGQYYTATTTDGNGGYVFPSASELTLEGGYDSATGLPFGTFDPTDVSDLVEGRADYTFSLSAPAGSAVITPLTSLVAAGTHVGLPDGSGQHYSDAESAAIISSAFGLSPSLDLLSLNPLAEAEAGDSAPFLLAAKLLDMLPLLQPLLKIDLGPSSTTDFLDRLGTYVVQHGPVDLDSAADILKLLPDRPSDDDRTPESTAAESQAIANLIAASNADLDAHAAASSGSFDTIAYTLAEESVVQTAEATAVAATEQPTGSEADYEASLEAVEQAYTGGNLDAAVTAKLGDFAEVASFGPSGDTATTAPVVHFTLRFTQAVTGVNPGAFQVVEGGDLTQAHVTGVTPVAESGGTEYDIAVSTGIGSGTVTLGFGGTGVLNAAGLPLTSGVFEPGKSYAALDPYGAENPTFAVGDFNGDGKPDVVRGDRDDGGVSGLTLLLNNGDGTFAPGPTIFSGSITSFDVATGDFNGDGKLDVATVGSQYRDISVLLGNGDGTFQKPIHGAVAGSSGGPLTVGDLNGDGTPDIATATTGGIAVLLGEGDGTFAAAPTLAVPAYASTIALADLNGDGSLDIVSNDNRTDTLSIFLGNGDGTFHASAQPTVAAGPQSQDLAIGDLNDDGIPDIAVADSYPGQITILLGNGDGTFRTAQPFVFAADVPYQDPQYGADSVHIADVNNDGRADLLVGLTNDREVRALFGDGTGRFSFGNDTPDLDQAGFGHDQIATADFDGDGRIDYVSPSFRGDARALGQDGIMVTLNAPQTVLDATSAPITITRSPLAQPTLAVASAATPLVQSGTTYTLDLGTLPQGTPLAALQFALSNAAAGPSDALGGTFGATTGDGFAIAGASLPSVLQAGQSYSGLTFTPDTGTPGQHTETITFAPRDQSATVTNYASVAGTDETVATTTSIDGANVAGQLPTLTLVVIDDVVAGPPPASLGAPGAITLPNARVGDIDTHSIAVTNTAAAGAGDLSVMASASGGATVAGSAAGLHPGASDTADIVGGVDTSVAGAIGGTVTLAPVSTDASGSSAALATVPVTVSGAVFRPAAGQVSPITAIVHVGDAGIVSVPIMNGDPADGYSEGLIAAIGNVSPGLAAASSGPTADIAAGASDSSLAIQVPTTTAGVVSGTVEIDLVSDGGTGAGSVDGLGQISLAPETAQIAITVDNYALAEIGETAGGISRIGPSTLDLGTVAVGSTPLTVSIAALNAASGPADVLAGTFTAMGSPAFSNALSDVAGIGAGGSEVTGTVTLSTAAAGQFTEVVTFTPSGGNASGYEGALPAQTLTITGTVAPDVRTTVASVTASGSGIADGAGDLGAGTVVTFTIDTTAPVMVAGGTPDLRLDDGGTAVFAGGSGTSALVFTTVVAPGQASPDLAITGLDLNGATARDANGVDADLSGAVTNPAGTLVVATAAPMTTPAVLTVTENAAATPIGILVPVDPSYAADRLVTTITGLPADGAVSLADGTPVPAGQALSGDQLAGLTFTAAAGMFDQNSMLTYTVADPARNATTGSVVLAIGPALSPTITGTVAGQATSETSSLTPFSTVVIGDPSVGQIERVTVSPGATTAGVLSDPNSAADGDAIDAAGVYTISGSAAQVSAALHGLAFTPAAHQAAPGSAVTTAFTIAVTNSAGQQAKDAAASVLVTAVEDPPVVGGTQAGQSITDQQALRPFSSVTLTDPDVNAVETATITLSGAGAMTDANGTLAGPGLARTGVGVYTLSSASPTAEQALLRALVFTPVKGAAGGTTSTNFGLQVTDGIATTDAGITVAVTSAPIVGPIRPTVTLALAGDTGRSATDEITSSAILFGTAGPNDTIAISEAGTLLGSAIANSAGAYSFAPTLTDGTYTLTASDTNASGSASAAISFTLDTTPPTLTAPVLTVASGAGATAIGIQVSDAVSSGAQLVATINALPDDGAVTLDGNAVHAGQVLTGTQLTELMFAPTAGLAAGSSTLRYSVTDVAGSTAAATASLIVGTTKSGGQGDVHMTTLDGMKYDFQATGDFVIAQAEVAGADDGFAIQMHAEEYHKKPGTSVATEIAARVGQDVVQFDLHGNPMIDGVIVAPEGGTGALQLADGSLRHVGNSWVLDWHSGESLAVTSEGYCLDFVVAAGAHDSPGTLQGLLGSDTGWSSDFQLRDGTVLEQPLSKSTILGQFADAWRVGANESLLGSSPATAAGTLQPTIAGSAWSNDHDGVEIAGSSLGLVAGSFSHHWAGNLPDMALLAMNSGFLH